MLRKTLLTISVLTVALVVAACGSSSEPADAQATAPAPIVPVAPASSSSVPTPAPAAVAPTQPPAPTVKVGNSVGNRAPDYEFSLTDGTKVTSASLVEQQEPAYLFFFATW